MSVAYGAAQGILQSLSQAFDGVVKSTGKAIDNVWDHRPLLIDDGKSELRLKMHFKLTEPVLAGWISQEIAEMFCRIFLQGC